MLTSTVSARQIDDEAFAAHNVEACLETLTLVSRYRHHPNTTMTSSEEPNASIVPYCARSVTLVWFLIVGLGERIVVLFVSGIASPSAQT